MNKKGLGYGGVVQKSTPSRAGRTYRRTLAEGFTVVELLIVVVVIAILAAITTIAYNGISDRAKASAAQSVASQAAKKLATYAITNNSTYPTDRAAFLAATGIIEAPDSSSTSYQYTSAAPNTGYCLTATTDNRSYYTTQANTTPTQGGCPGHGVNGVAAITNFALNPSFELNTFFWGRSGTSPAATNYSRSTLRSHAGTASLQQDITASGQTGVAAQVPSSGERLRVDEGEGASWSFWVYSTKAGTLAPWCDGELVAGGYAGLSGGSTIAIPANSWTKVVGTGTRSIGSGDMYIAQCGGYNLSVASGDQLWFDEFMITQGVAQHVFATGHSSNWVWNGTPDNSTSTGSPL